MLSRPLIVSTLHPAPLNGAHLKAASDCGATTSRVEAIVTVRLTSSDHLVFENI